MNKVFMIGNITRDVELRYLPSGAPIGKFGLAVNQRWKDRNTGKDREETLFIDVNIFGRSAETANQYLHKGSKVLIEGRLQLERWTDKSGQQRSKHSVVAESLQFLDSKPKQERTYESFKGKVTYDSKNDPLFNPADEVAF